MTTLEVLTGHGYLSYSALSTYLECGEKYRLTRVESVPRLPAYWFPGGTAVHTGTEIYDLSLLDGATHGDAVDAAIKGFHSKFTEEMRLAEEQNPGKEWRAGGRATKANPNKEDATWWRNSGPIQVKQYCEWRQAHGLLQPWFTPDNEPAIELSFELELGGVKTRGYIDRVMQNQTTGDLIVVDIKSGSRIPADQTQLALYCTAVEHMHGIRPQFAAYFMTRKAELTQLSDLSRFNEEMAGLWLSKAKQGIESLIFLPHQTSMCGSCEVENFCYARNGDIAIPDFSTYDNMTQSLYGQESK